MTGTPTGEDPINDREKGRDDSIEEESTDIKAEELSLTEEGEWQPFASFVVEFQTRQIEGRTDRQTKVWHRETNTSQTWLGIASEQLGQWMLKRVGEVLPLQPIAKQLARSAPVTVEIGHLRLLQPPRTKMPKFINQAGQIFPDPILRSDEPFTLEIYFGITELAAVNINPQQVTYRARCYLRNLTGDRSISLSLGETQPTPLVKGQSFYTTVLPETVLPRGIHLLQVLVTLQGQDSPKPLAASSFEFSWLQVV